MVNIPQIMKDPLGNDASATAAKVVKQAVTTPQQEEIIPFMTSEHNGDHAKNGPCSNDNPNYHLNTQPCPGAIALIFDGIDPNEFGDTTSTDTVTTPMIAGIVDGDDNGVGNDDGATDGEGTLNGDGSGSGINIPVVTNGSMDIIDGDSLAGDDGGSGNNASTDPSETDGDAPNGDDENAANPAVGGIDGDTTASTGSGADPTTYPDFYSCSATSEEELVNSETNEALPVTFNYEIYTSSNVADVTAVLNTFERQLSNGVAKSLGLVDCPDTEIAVEVALRSSDRGGGGRRRSLQKATPWGEARRLDTDVTESLVVGVSMDPVDELDTELAGCTSSVTLDTPSTCSPIIGAMTAWIPSSAQTRHLRRLAEAETKAEQEAVLRSTVQSYIEGNGDAYLTDDLLHVAYVDRSNTATLPADEFKDGNAGNPTQIVDMNAAPEEKSLNFGMIGLGVALAVLVLVAVGAAVAYRRRSQRRRQALSEHGAQLDLESRGAFPALTPESESMKNNRYSDDNDTQDAVPSLNETPEDTYDSLTLLTGAQRSDDMMDDEDGKPPSVLAALGVASTITHQLSNCQPPSTPPNSLNESGDQEEQDVTRDADNSRDIAPLGIPDPDESNNDIAPMSPMVDEQNDYSSESDDESDVSAVGPTEDYSGDDEAPAVSPGPSMDDSGPSMDTTMPTENTKPTLQQADDDSDSDDESQQSIGIV